MGVRNHFDLPMLAHEFAGWLQNRQDRKQNEDELLTGRRTDELDRRLRSVESSLKRVGDAADRASAEILRLAKISKGERQRTASNVMENLQGLMWAAELMGDNHGMIEAKWGSPIMIRPAGIGGQMPGDLQWFGFKIPDEYEGITVHAVQRWRETYMGDPVQTASPPVPMLIYRVVDTTSAGDHSPNPWGMMGPPFVTVFSAVDAANQSYVPLEIDMIEATLRRVLMHPARAYHDWLLTREDEQPMEAESFTHEGKWHRAVLDDGSTIEMSTSTGGRGFMSIGAQTPPPVGADRGSAVSTILTESDVENLLAELKLKGPRGGKAMATFMTRPYNAVLRARSYGPNLTVLRFEQMDEIDLNVDGHVTNWLISTLAGALKGGGDE